MTTMISLESGAVRAAGPSTTLSLREWLGQRWAILFSHPGDFDREQLERDRWISVLGRSFRQHAVRPLALARYGHDARGIGWLAELGHDCAAALLTTARPGGALLDLRVSTLRAEIAEITGSGARFAMIIDSDLRCRRTVHYRAAIELPSPIEFVGWAVALRERQRTAALTERDSTPRVPRHALS